MKTYEKNIQDRKTLVKRIEELTGEKPRYTFAPRMSYQFANCAVEKYGELTVEDGMDMSVIETLITEGFIKPEATAEETAPDEIEVESIPEENTAEEEVTEADETPKLGQEAETIPEEPVTAETEAQEVDGLVISIPLAKHTPESLRRLLNLFFSRGSLISKATGGNFSVEMNLLTALDKEGLIRTTDEFVRKVDELGGLTGITFSDGKLNFTGFPFTYDSAKLAACQQLACAISKHAIQQKRIQAKIVNEENEKYIFRIWLVRIGMEGDEYKETRKVLLENLTGNTAFRTKADEDKWKEKQLAKKQELQAAKEEAKAAVLSE